jgi:hypothetical protein
MTPTLNLNDVIRDMARAHAQFDYPRPLGVDGPHVGDIGTDSPALDLSHEATPASEDIANLITVCMPLQDSLIREAVMRLAKSALAKIEAGQRA